MSHLRARTTPPAVLFSLIGVLALILLGGCNDSQPTADPSAQATISALATSNAQLATQVAELSAAALGAASGTTAVGVAEENNPQDNAQLVPHGTGSQSDAEAAVPTPAPPAAAQAAGNGLLPLLVTAVELAPEGETLFDLRLDRNTNHIFVTDSTGQLHVLDATTYAPITVLPFGGWLQLDSRHNRLYVYRPFVTEGEESLIHVVDTSTLEEIGTIAGRALAIDAERNRLFVGEPYGISTPPDAPGVRILDGATLQQTGAFTQTGEPVYNPQLDELLIVAYTVYGADPETQQVMGDLYPELTDLPENGFLWCNGCPWVDSAHYYPAEQLVAVTISTHCAGKGCGVVSQPRFYDANTMQPVEPALAPQVQADCGSGGSLVSTAGERRYVNTMYDRYVVYNNLQVTDEQGALLTMRDGLRIDYVNERTGQGYLYDGMVIDLPSLSPIGRWPAACLFAEEPDTGLLFGRRGSNLLVIAERGGQVAAPESPQAATLPPLWPIRQVVVSPNFGTDNTVLAVSGGGIYRSLDGSQSWQQLRGGLPQGEGSNWVVAFSPAYAADRTLFAGGDRGEYWGEGAWRSQDGGETWQPQWTDLQHRRINNFYFSPEFASNQTMVVQADYFDIAASQSSGESYQQSLDGGVTWTLVVTGSVYTAEGLQPLPPVSELLPGYVAQANMPVRISPARNSILASADGANWITATLDLPEAETLYSVLPSPGYPSDATIFLFGNNSLWRSIDNGATWSAWDDPRLAGLDYTSNMNAAAISPEVDGGYRLFVGTANGQVWPLNPAEMQWTEPRPANPVQAEAPAQAALTSTVPSTDTASVQPNTPAPVGTPVPIGTPAPVVGAAGPTETGTLTGTAPLTSTPAPGALVGDPPEGLFRPSGTFGLFWEKNVRMQQDLGWARAAQPASTGGALQNFDGGTMAWRQDTGQIYVFYSDGTWQTFTDTFEEGDPESNPSLVVPQGKLQPIRGFGKVWRDNADVRRKMGWALAKEEALNVQVLQFERGAMLQFGGRSFTVIGIDTDTGRWY